MSTLVTAWRYRLGGTQGSRCAGSQAERRFADFVVDGAPLREVLGASARDLITVLGWGDPLYDLQTVEQLLLRSVVPTANGRHMLLVCPECGDLGCGAITADVGRSGNVVTWSRFGFENNYDPGMSDFDSFRAVGPFTFEADQYEVALRQALVRRDV